MQKDERTLGGSANVDTINHELIDCSPAPSTPPPVRTKPLSHQLFGAAPLPEPEESYSDQLVVDWAVEQLNAKRASRCSSRSDCSAAHPLRGPVAFGNCRGLISRDPSEGRNIGQDLESSVGDYIGPFKYAGKAQLLKHESVAIK